MVLTDVRIKNFCILKKSISVNISVDNARKEVIDELKKLNGKRIKYAIELEPAAFCEKKTGLYVEGAIKSLTLTGGVSFSLHTDIEKFIIFKLLEIRETEGKTTIKFQSQTEADLQAAIKEASEKLGVSEEEALIRATTFKHVKGRGSIYELTDRHKVIALEKLRKIILREKRAFL